MKRHLLFFVFLCIAPLSYATAALKVVTTLSTYADIVKAIGGEEVEASYVASPRFNPHFIEPKPSDVYKVKMADLFVHSGLDLEAWRDPLVQASGRADFKVGGANQLDLSVGIPLLEVPIGQPSRSEGDIHLYGNPHYWLSPENGIIIAETIAAKLSAILPDRKGLFETNLADFKRKLESKIAGWKSALSSFKNFELIGYHNEWIYLMNFLGLSMTQFLEPKPGIPPTPRHIEFLTEYISGRKIRAIVQTSFYPLDAAESLQEKTGIRIAILCQNVGELPAAKTYLEMLDYNIAEILNVLAND